MPFGNTSSPTEFLEKTQSWVDNGLPVEGMPFYEELQNISMFQWEQITVDIIIILLLSFIIVKVVKTSVVANRVLHKVDILMDDHKFDRYKNKKLFKELR